MRFLSRREWEALPPPLQPLLRHACPDVADSLQQPVLDRARRAAERTRWGFEQLTQNPTGVERANDHIRVHVPPAGAPSKL